MSDNLNRDSFTFVIAQILQRLDAQDRAAELDRLASKEFRKSSTEMDDLIYDQAKKTNGRVTALEIKFQKDVLKWTEILPNKNNARFYMVALTVAASSQWFASLILQIPRLVHSIIPFL